MFILYTYKNHSIYIQYKTILIFILKLLNVVETFLKQYKTRLASSCQSGEIKTRLKLFARKNGKKNLLHLCFSMFTNLTLRVTQRIKKSRRPVVPRISLSVARFHLWSSEWQPIHNNNIITIRYIRSPHCYTCVLNFHFVRMFCRFLTIST